MFILDTLNPFFGNFNPKKFWNWYKGLGNRGGPEDTFTQEQVNTAVADGIAAHVQASATTGWKEGLPDDIKADPLWAKYETQNDAHKGLIDAQKFLGREKLPDRKSVG